MFGIANKDIQPILKLVEQFPPPAPADTSKLGAWGIVFLCCGAMAARNRRWAEKLMNSLNDIGPSAMMRALLGENVRPDEDYAIRFSERIVQWCNDNHAWAEARRRMEKYGERMSPAQ